MTRANQRIQVFVERWKVFGALIVTILLITVLLGTKWVRGTEMNRGKFIRAGMCEDAIEEAVEDAVEEACDNALYACQAECPSEVYDYDRSDYLSNTDVNSLCEDACQVGKDNCEP